MATSKRRWSERLLLVVNLTVANAVAGVWIATFLQPRVLGVDLTPVPGMFGEQRVLVMPLGTLAAWLAFAGAIVLLLWNFSWLVRRGDGGQPANWVVSESRSGAVRVAREAIENGLQKAGEAQHDISRMRVQVTLPSPRRIAITGQFHCVEGADHLAASQRLRESLLARFGELVQLGDGVRAEFELEFQGFFGKAGKHAPEAPKPAPPATADEADAEPFRGPQYPIDDDEQ